MQRRAFTSTLTLLTALLAAPAAKASTNATITGSGSKTISDVASGEWSEDTQWGAFGASYSAGYAVHSNYNGSDKYEKVEGDVSGKLFGASVQFMDGSLKVHAGQSSTLYGDYYLSVFGTTVLNVANDNLSATSNSTFEYTFFEGEVAGVDMEASMAWGADGKSVQACVSAGADADMKFVGIPITAGASGSGCVGLEVTTDATYDSTTKSSTIYFKGEPYASLGLELTAGIGTSDVSAGTYGEVTLFEVSVPITNTLSVTPTSSTSATMQYGTSGYLTLSSLAGEIGLYVKILLIKYKYTLFDWDGVTWANQLLFTDSVPIASAPTLTVSGTEAKAAYTYTDINPESGSSIKWQRANDSAGTGSADIQTGSSKTWTLTTNETNKYLRFCVTPSNGANDGSEVCSKWVSVGPIISFYWDGNYGGSTFSYAYGRSQSGTCKNVSSVKSSWNDDISSYKLYTSSSCTTTMHLYKDADCTGGEVTRTVSPGGSDLVSSVGNSFGSSWNDSISSFNIVYCDWVTASDVSVSFSNDQAKGNYSIDSASIFTTDESSYVWYRSSSASGSGATQVGTSQDYSLGAADNGQYLRFCVKPNNGTTSGSEVCSDWTYVLGVSFYWDSNYSGYDFTFAYKQAASGTCFNLSSVKANWNDDVSSLKILGQSSGPATIWVYKDANCTGAVATTTVSANSTASVASMSNYGSGWNDEISSFKVTY